MRILIVLLLLVASCTQPTKRYENLIPKPAGVKTYGESFTLSPSTIIYVDNNPELIRIAEYLAAILRRSTGYPLKVMTASTAPADGNLYLSIDENLRSAEGYQLITSSKGIQLTAFKPAGIFRGVQTLRQLCPPGIERTIQQEGPWEIPAVIIDDHPAYPVRGSMLDVARHFFSVEDVKRYIDLIAYYKMNTLHLHLTDDQGWRIEIKSWPRLTTIGSTSQVGPGKGGFYTQEQYKDIVQYAADRYITIIPEIDMPGHTNAALASYAELNCSDTARQLYTGVEVGFSTLCTRKEITYAFIDSVLRELAAITPGPYLHIGGDESRVTAKEDYIYFVTRVQDIVAKYKKQAIGWDDISQAKLLPNTIAQFWYDSANSINAVKQGAKIIMSPTNRAYLDIQYDSLSRIGLHWGGYIEVDSSYMWNPESFVKGIPRKNILGVEAPLWGETLKNMEDIEYLAFPRLPGIAEIGWSPSNNRNWDEYKHRLAQHSEFMKALDIDYYPSAKVPWPAAK